MKYYHAALIVLVCFAGFVGMVNAETKSGPITLAEQKIGEKMPSTVTFGNKIKVSCTFNIVDFFGEKVVAAGATVKNTAPNPMFYSYNVAFFDEKNNLLGCASQRNMDDGLKSGEETQLGSCLISMPPTAIAKVKTYQVTFYVSDKKIGGK